MPTKCVDGRQRSKARRASSAWQPGEALVTIVHMDAWILPNCALRKVK